LVGNYFKGYFSKNFGQIKFLGKIGNLGNPLVWYLGILDKHGFFGHWKDTNFNCGGKFGFLHLGLHNVI